MNAFVYVQNWKRTLSRTLTELAVSWQEGNRLLYEAGYFSATRTGQRILSLIRISSTSMHGAHTYSTSPRQHALSAMDNSTFMPTADIVQLIVGEARADVQTKTWAAHKSVLCRIPYFQRCLQHSFREQQEREIHLPEDSPEVIRHILHYVYSRGMIGLTWNDKVSNREAEERDRLYLIVEVYITADKFSMEGLQNDIVDSFIQYHRHRFVCPPSILMLHDLPKCHLRHFLLRKFAYGVLSQSFKDMVKNDSACSATGMDGITGEDFHDIMRCISLQATNGLNDPGRGARCRWHEHAITPKCA